MKIELKNIKVNLTFSEETTMFKADLFVNGIKAGYAYNDGHGGSTGYNYYPGKRGEIKDAEEYCNSLPDGSFSYGDKVVTYKMNLERFIDDEIDKYVKKKEDERLEKRLKKDMLKGIVYGTKNNYKLVSWGGYTLEQLLNHKSGIMVVKLKIKDLKKKGETILNTNLPESL